MKIAITSTGATPDAMLDHRFGRCSYFVIYDTETRSTEYLPNPAKDAEEGAGPMAVQLVASRGVQKIVSGEFGMKIKPLLDSLKIQMIAVKEEGRSVNAIITMLNH
jgi:predicted Fe-Mo cluster-binding NifX family protein